MDIQLRQGSWYRLVFPLLVNGGAVTGITNARFALYRGQDEILTLSMGDDIAFNDSSLFVTLDETETVKLLGAYRYELWIVDQLNNPIFVRSDRIAFAPTNTRF